MVWGLGLRLAGKAFSNPASRSAIASGTTAIGAAMMLPGVQKGIRDEIKGSDLNMSEGEKHSLNPLQKTILTGWPLSDTSKLEKKLTESTYKRQVKDIKKQNPQIRKIENALGKKFEAGEDPDDFIATHAEAYKEYLNEEEREKFTRDEKTKYNTPGAIRERRREDAADQLAVTKYYNERSDAERTERMRLAELRESRLQKARESQKDREIQILKLDQTDRQNQYEMDKYMHELEYKKSSRRKERTSNLIQALAGLGAAFAI